MAKRFFITLDDKSIKILNKIKKSPFYKQTWLSDFVNKKLESLSNELELIRFETSVLNEKKEDINARLSYLADKAKQLREKQK